MSRDDPASSYRLRMIFCQWYINLFDKAGELINRMGPFANIHEANKWAEDSGLMDGDRGY